MNSVNVSESWSNFLTQGGGTEGGRWDVFEKLQEVRLENTNRTIWREYFGEVLISLMELTSPEELNELLVCSGYLDLKSYIAAQAVLGKGRAAAIGEYKRTVLELQ